MKRFIISVLCVTVFCVGLGALVEKAGASFKSDEKALGIIKQARLAIGGDQSIADVRSMIIKGNTTMTFKVEGTARTEQGETEIAMQLPDKLSRTVKIGRHGGEGGDNVMNETHDVILMRHPANGEVAGEPGEKRVFVRKIEGAKAEGGNVEVERVLLEGKEGEFKTSDGDKVIIRKIDGGEIAGGENVKTFRVEEAHKAEHMAHRQNELLRMTLSLLLTAPEGMDVSYTFVGEGDVDGTNCNIVNAEFAGTNVKLYLSKASSLPVMVAYQGHARPNVMFFRTKDPAAPPAVLAAGPTKEKMILREKIDVPEVSEVQVRFADYRSVNGVQLPYKWTTSVAGQTSEVFDVANYDLNPANIAEKFQNQRVLVRTKKEAN